MAEALLMSVVGEEVMQGMIPHAGQTARFALQQAMPTLCVICCRSYFRAPGDCAVPHTACGGARGLLHLGQMGRP